MIDEYLEHRRRQKSAHNFQNILTIDEMVLSKNSAVHQRYNKTLSSQVNSLLTKRMIYYSYYLKFAFNQLALISQLRNSTVKETIKTRDCLVTNLTEATESATKFLEELEEDEKQLLMKQEKKQKARASTSQMVQSVEPFAVSHFKNEVVSKKKTATTTFNSTRQSPSRL